MASSKVQAKSQRPESDVPALPSEIAASMSAWASAVAAAGEADTLGAALAGLLQGVWPLGDVTCGCVYSLADEQLVLAAQAPENDALPWPALFEEPPTGWAAAEAAGTISLPESGLDDDLVGAIGTTGAERLLLVPLTARGTRIGYLLLAWPAAYRAAFCPRPDSPP